MGLNVFTLFVGFGLGSLIFRGLLQFGFAIAFGVFAVAEALIAAASHWPFPVGGCQHTADASCAKF